MKTSLLIFLLITATCIMYAQSPDTPQNLFLGLEPMEEIMMDDEDPMFEPDLTGIDHKIIAYFMVSDTITISNIHVKLGTTDGGNELFDSLFVFDNYELSENQEYRRYENNISITLGVFEWSETLYAELKLENFDGQFSNQYPI